MNTFKMTDLVNFIGDLFQASFTILPVLGNSFNLLLIVLFSITFFICLRKFI
tara:strand:+ start:454 stop:609 length:156 start_codon:yes stop_codon:yes gene_type:complete